MARGRDRPALVQLIGFLPGQRVPEAVPELILGE
jgi:hypothetical protein